MPRAKVPHLALLEKVQHGQHQVRVQVARDERSNVVFGRHGAQVRRDDSDASQTQQPLQKRVEDTSYAMRDSLAKAARMAARYVR